MKAKTRRQPPAVNSAAKSWRTYALMFVCALLLVTGFFFAGRQHFASMDFGMKNSRLRNHIDDLEAEKRRLLLAREVSLSPAEIKRVAKKSGLVEYGLPVAELAQKPTVEPSKTVPHTIKSVASDRPIVTKTASVEATKSAAKPAFAKLERTEKAPKKTLMAE